ncbi:NAD(P)H-dependent glycerol-3-phosphate dehydrogenase [Desulfurivibrio alkaliphilus]|uniref:Glycerol-3-phosphate dehydrogenase [NAD(P)+] n=1 Tax=Desulfurivibrio alkaliphilus (strain DSM 19089 / UNIQEM U267 / AHT2) TaxID=589865 RepID=D6Z5N9_DESAT|nr:NAD(P)H-dependent glycerol-3-phosphate dehydrogenase [Desulfurivibrio alkaliphilus]ADH86776.1 Glycerol-3-phosphate dehydrogenase (NAD(P)(+)) [Desulfurivibrio alkaliphilus AHT 2]
MVLPAAERIAVVGAGSWGTALALVLARKGYPVELVGHTPERVAEMRQSRRNSRYLPDFSLPENIFPGADPAVVAGCQAVVMVVPSHGFRAVFRQLIPHLSPATAIISAAKGIENDTLLTMTQVMAQELSQDPAGSLLPGPEACPGNTGSTAAPAVNHPLGVLAGPSFAREVAEGLPTAVTVAAALAEESRFFQELFFTERFRVYAGTDLIGQELGGALKNIIAIAAGISDGLGYGTNSRAALITRGLAEITRLGVKMGAKPLTFSGLAGLGDLVLTCTGELSRNRGVGLKLGQGMTLAEILDEMQMVAEGIKTTASAWDLAQKMKVEMPILEQVYQVIYQDKPCREAVRDLLAREGRDELE